MKNWSVICAERTDAASIYSTGWSIRSMRKKDHQDPEPLDALRDDKNAIVLSKRDGIFII